MSSWITTLITLLHLSSFGTARATEVAVDANNVFHITEQHTVEAIPRTSSTTTSTCVNECKSQPRGRLLCTLTCSCRLQCSEQYAPETTNNYRRKRRRCRKRCPRRAAKKVERRKAKRDQQRAELKAEQEAAQRAMLDEQTRQSLTNVASDGPILRSSIDALVQWALPNFNPDQPVQTYGNCVDLKRDIEAAVANEVDRILDSCSDNDMYYGGGVITLETARDREPQFAETVEDTSATTGVEEVTEDSFLTNKQEDNVDEDDIVKSDGLYVHIAYGHEVITTNASTGEVYARTDVKPERNETDYYTNVQGQVQGLLLNDCVLAAVVTGYTYTYLYCDVKGRTYEPPILSDMGSTTLRFYDACNIPTDGNSSLIELNSFHLRGRFVESRGIGDTIHVVSQSNIQHGLNHYITYPLSRWQGNYSDMNCTQYQETAANDSIALIRDFGNRLINEIASVDPNCSSVARITAFASGLEESEDGGDSTGGAPSSSRMRPDIWNGEPIIGALTSITSVKLGNISHVKATEPATASAWFRGYTNIVYSSVRTLILAANSYRFWGLGGGEQSTYLMSCELMSDGQPSKWGATGIVPGSTKDSYSMSERDGHLRIATTTRERLACRPNPNPKDNSTDEDWCRFWCCHGWETVANSSSQIMILNLDGPSGTMEEVSNVTGLGETEEIRSVRYFEDFVVVVTFRLTDPLYTIDLTNNTATVLGELKIDGYSSYMQEYYADDGTRMLLALGQNADPETGRDLGLQISLFNISDLLQPNLTIRYNVEQGNQETQWSSSDAQFEPKALRYLPQSKLLIIPAYVGSRDNSFDGFLIFYVTPELIEERYAVSMADGNLIGGKGICWGCAYVQSRSIVISGDATLIKGHYMQNIELTDGTSRWNASLDRPIIGKEDCCGYFWVFRPMPDICGGPFNDIARPVEVLDVAVESEP